ncbi:peptidase C39 [Pontibacillus sp. HMF3514]|nr:peptidase C39 [Pontibacillus sp. HMF3514]
MEVKGMKSVIISYIICTILFTQVQAENIRSSRDHAIHKISLTQKTYKFTASRFTQPLSTSIKLDVPIIRQMPELPRGCEVTSLAMILQHNGINVGKNELAKKVKRDPTPYQVKNGQVKFGNPNRGFVGDMYSFQKPGLGVYHKPIHQLAQVYAKDRAVDLTGKSFNVILEHVSQGVPVWVIQNSSFDRLSKKHWMKWQTQDGPVDITYHEHSVVITGFDEHNVYINDPLTGTKHRKLNKKAFIRGWDQMGRQAIVIQKG